MRLCLGPPRCGCRRLGICTQGGVNVRCAHVSLPWALLASSLRDLVSNRSIVRGLGRLHFSHFCPATQHRHPSASTGADVPSSSKGRLIGTAKPSNALASRRDNPIQSPGRRQGELCEPWRSPGLRTLSARSPNGTALRSNASSSDSRARLRFCLGPPRCGCRRLGICTQGGVNVRCAHVSLPWALLASSLRD